MGGAPAAEILAEVEEAVSARLGRRCTTGDVRRLSGGASRQTWSVTMDDPAATTVVVQQERPGSVGMNLPMRVQADLLTAAAAEGVPVPEVLACSGEEGRAVVVLAHLPGESVPRRLFRDEALSGVRDRLAVDAGAVLAAIHRIDPAPLPRRDPGDPVTQLRSIADVVGEPHPAFELCFSAMAADPPPERPEVLVHGDFRMGNLLVSREGITGVLDWELAHRGSAVEDLGWFCVRAWRFGSPERAGGVGSVEALLEGYSSAGGDAPGPEEVSWWEAWGTLRWGLICVLQAGTHLRGHHRSVELAAIGRRAAECEEDALGLVFGPSDHEPEPAGPDTAVSGPHDRPTAVELLEAVEEHLAALRRDLDDGRGFHLLVAGRVLAMVGREIVLGPRQAADHAATLASLGEPDDAALCAALRAGRFDGRLEEVAAALRRSVRDKLAVSNPGYWRGDAAGTGR